MKVVDLEKIMAQTSHFDLTKIPEENRWGSSGICTGCSYKKKCLWYESTFSLMPRLIEGTENLKLIKAQVSEFEICPVRLNRNE